MRFDGLRVAVLLLLLAVAVCTPIDMELPELKRIEMVVPTENYTIKSREYFKYEFEEAINPVVAITASPEQTSHDCVFNPRSFELQEVYELKLNTLEGSRLGHFHSDMMQLRMENLIYTVTNRLSVTAYSYDQREIHKLRTYDVHVDNYVETMDSKAHFAVSHDEGSLYLFSIYGAWHIDPKNILEKVKPLGTAYSMDVADSAVIGENIVLVGPNEGLVIYKVLPDGNLSKFAQVREFNGHQLNPVSLAVDDDNGLLYALDQSRNIYIFTFLQEQIAAYDLIEVQHVYNFAVRVAVNRLYYSFVDGGNARIAELSYDFQERKATLIRYYKMFDYIYDFQVYGEQMVALTQETIEVVPTNIDPRLITREHNGVRLTQRGRKMVMIAHEVFVLLNQQSIRIMRMRSLMDRIECQFLSEHKLSVQIKYQANTTNCEGRPKKAFNSYCEVTKLLSIDVDIPEEAERQKTYLFSIVALVVVLFMVGLVCLIQWRNGRLDLIDKLAQEIRQFRSRGKRGVALEENQIEIPQILTEEQMDSDRKRHQPTDPNAAEDR